jgi:hypothetical protein
MPLQSLNKVLKQFEAGQDHILSNLVLRLRFLGVISQSEYTEYGFSIEDKDKSRRRVVLTIRNALFRQNNLMFQEAPDLCYQKVLAGLEEETSDFRIPARMPITTEDIIQYRDLHPKTKNRKQSRPL